MKTSTRKKIKRFNQYPATEQTYSILIFVTRIISKIINLALISISIYIYIRSYTSVDRFFVIEFDKHFVSYLVVMVILRLFSLS